MSMKQDLRENLTPSSTAADDKQQILAYKRFERLSTDLHHLLTRARNPINLQKLTYTGVLLLLLSLKLLSFDREVLILH
ncbi:hypothetical protein KC322_g49 [Hortaea werneckii]|nr:hypothetical protein KC322_g49 [Hortaea werneckii]